MITEGWAFESICDQGRLGVRVPLGAQVYIRWTEGGAKVSSARMKPGACGYEAVTKRLHRVWMKPGACGLGLGLGLRTYKAGRLRRRAGTKRLHDGYTAAAAVSSRTQEQEAVV